MIEAIFSNNRALFLIGFAFFLAVLMWFDRGKVERKSILFFRKTEKGIKEIDRLAKKFPRFWSFYGSLGVIIGVLTIFISTGLIGFSLYEMGAGIIEGDDQASEQSGIGLVLPGVSGEYEFRSGAFLVPAEYWVISIAIIMFVHEMSHAVVARAEDFEINSIGWIVIGILPGAFVEPKGDKMLTEGEITDANTDSSTGLWDQGNWKSRLKVLCAGSWANYIVGAIFLLLVFGMTQNMVFYNAQDDFPAQAAGMNNGTLYEINGVPVKSTDDVRDGLSDLMPGEEVDFYTSEGNFTVTAVENPEQEDSGYIGIQFGESRVSSFEDSENSSIISWLIGLIFSIAFLNLAIGLFNMLPAKPLDGGQVLDTFVREFKGDSYVSYVNKFSLVVWLVLIASLLVAILL